MDFAPVNSRGQYHGQLSKDADEYIDFIVNAGNRMRGFIDSMLLYAKSGSLNPKEIKSLNLNDVFSTIQKNLLSDIQKTDARIVTKGQLPTVTGSEMQITQLLQNLISNAIKFRKPNTAPQISIRAEAVDSMWLVTVEDNGQGIDSKNIPYIFDFLRRFNVKIVQAHGGTIKAKSEPGKGATFQFSLPCTITTI